MTRTNFLAVFSPLLLAVIFFLSGISKIADPAATEGYIAPFGLPVPPLGLVIAIIVEFGGGILLVIGYRTHLVSSILAAFIFATAVFFHNDFADQNQMIHFLKNIAMIGGLLQVAAFGAGGYSVDARRVQEA